MDNASNSAAAIIITPTVGRIVWFHPAIADGRDPNNAPLAGTVAKVISDRCVNLTVSHGDGTIYAAQNVKLLQHGDEFDPDAAYAEWMPYQKGQAAKAEAAESPLHAKIEQFATHVDNKIETMGQGLLRFLTTELQAIETRLGGYPKDNGEVVKSATTDVAADPAAKEAAPTELTARLTNFSVNAQRPVEQPVAESNTAAAGTEAPGPAPV